jgi:hypothetical protein
LCSHSMELQKPTDAAHLYDRHVLQDSTDFVCRLNKSAAARRLQAVKQIDAAATYNGQTKTPERFHTRPA